MINGTNQCSQQCIQKHQNESLKFECLKSGPSGQTVSNARLMRINRD